MSFHSRPVRTAIMAVLFAVAAIAPLAHAQPESSPAHTPVGGKLKSTIPDVELVNQEGRRVHLYSDLVKGKAVAINFIYTHCENYCPRQGRLFTDVQRRLQEQMGKEVSLISVSIDPERDSPERLKEWAARQGVQPGWTLLTGDRKVINQVLLTLVGAILVPGDHEPFVLVGSDFRSDLAREGGMGSGERVAALLTENVHLARPDLNPGK
jgi:protein SCO1/2